MLFSFEKLVYFDFNYLVDTPLIIVVFSFQVMDTVFITLNQNKIYHLVILNIPNRIPM